MLVRDAGCMVNDGSKVRSSCSRRHQIESQAGYEVKQENIRRETCKSLTGWKQCGTKTMCNNILTSVRFRYGRVELLE